MSSSGFPITASNSPTGAILSGPTRILRSTPLPIASTSIFTLSVSISTTVSPVEMASPSFLSHFRTLPSVIVSLPLGIITLTAMGSSLERRNSKSETRNSKLEIRNSGLVIRVSARFVAPNWKFEASR
jgi:hypothetical protein